MGEEAPGAGSSLVADQCIHGRADRVQGLGPRGLLGPRAVAVEASTATYYYYGYYYDTRLLPLHYYYDYY